MSMGYGMGGAMFSVIPIIVVIGFVVILSMILVSAFRGAGQWHKNNQSPVLTVEAQVVAKRTNVNVHHHHHGDNHAMGHTTRSTTYYATFQVESGDRMELRVSAQEYGMLAEGDQGRLTFQGTRYQGFDRMR